MLGANGLKVQRAPISVVFAADLESSRLVPRLLTLLRRAKTFPEAFLKNVPFFTSLFSSGYRTGLVRFLLYWGKRIATTVLGLFQPVPRPERPETWAVKNTMLAAMTLMLAATANGLTTCPMEGFDQARVRKALGIPRRYHVPLVVALGYEAVEEGKGGETAAQARTERYQLEEVAFQDRFGVPFPAPS